MAVQHVYSQTVGDGTATSVVRPSDWNSFHNQYLTISGNTAGQSTVSGTNVVFQGGNNVTLSANTAAGAATIIVSAANTVAQTVQTQPSGNIAGAGFSSTTTAGTAVVGTLNSNGLSIGVPTIITNALTTARASNDGVGLNTAATNVTWTVNSGGISLNAGAYLTTAAQSSASNVSAVYAGTASNGGTATLSGGVSFSNANGVSFYTSAGNAVVATVKTDYLTTAAQVSHSHGNPTLNLTNITGTTASASNGLTLSLSGVAAQTTQTQAAGNIAGVGTTFAGTNVTATMGLNSNGLALSLNAAGGGGTQSLYAVSNTTQSSSGTYTNGLSFAGAGIASVGISNGSVVVSVPSGGGAGDGYNIVSMGSSGNTTGTAWSSLSASLGIYGGNNITVSQNNSNQIVISAPSGGGVGVSNLGNTSGNTGAVSDRVVFAGTGGVLMSQSTNGQSATITVGIDPIGNYVPFPLLTTIVQVFSQNSLSFQHFNVPVPVKMNNLELYLKMNAGASSTNSQSVAQTINYGFYSQDTGTNSTRMTLIGSSTAQIHASYNSSTTASVHFAVGGSTVGTAGNSGVFNSIGSNFMHLYLPFATTFQPNVKYAMGLLISSATTVGSNPLRISGFFANTISASSAGRFAGGGMLMPNTSNIGDYEMGMYLTSTGAMVNSYATSQMSYLGSRPKLFMQFDY